MSNAPLVVTGAGSGIGNALVRRLRADGQEVLALDRRFPDDEVGSVGGGANLVCDLSDPDSIADTVLRVPDRIAGLANVAGVPGTADTRTVLAVNYLGTRALTSALAARIGPGGAVVNVASVAAHRNTLPDEEITRLLEIRTLDELDLWLTEHEAAGEPFAGPAAYDTSKRLVVDWTKHVAAELLPSGVRCLSVSPGPVTTPILDDFAASMGQASMDRSVQAVGRHGRPDEIAAVIAFVLSSDARWVNGVDIMAEGGLLATRAAAAQPLAVPALQEPAPEEAVTPQEDAA
ncbi:SDR family oxidoreductase [Streptomyces sp. NPDC127091]|uniref:SDR family oxidoreductase n=1 Tax=Streptomyces sp. NPDC127091 TaxID=3347134 RepID=UPI00364E5439